MVIILCPGTVKKRKSILHFPENLIYWMKEKDDALIP